MSPLGRYRSRRCDDVIEKDLGTIVCEAAGGLNCTRILFSGGILHWQYETFLFYYQGIKKLKVILRWIELARDHAKRRTSGSATSDKRK